MTPLKPAPALLNSVSSADRERLLGQKGKIIWFTGLSGAGKSTLANALEVQLHRLGKQTVLLDGDAIRTGLNQDLGFSDADRAENIRRIAQLSKLMMDAGLIVICAFISPFQKERDMARRLAGDGRFLEIYVSTPLQICIERDPKGHYKKAAQGRLNQFTGIDSQYEVPTHPELVLDTSALSINQSIQAIMDRL